MAVDKNKILENAAKYLEKGQVDKALKEYSSLLEIDPKNIPARQKRAELYARKGMKREALEDYIRVGEDYSKGGFYQKAVSALKLALQVDNRQLILYLRLAELFHKLGLASDAMQNYRFVASYYDREGKVKECLDILRKMVELDPENLASRVKLGELYFRQGMKAESQEEFSRVAQTLKEEGRNDDLITLYERILSLYPMNINAIKALGQLYLSKNEPQKALAKLQVPLKEGTRDRELLELLAKIYYFMKREDKAKNALKELARICREDGDEIGMKECYKKILRIDPEDQDAKQVIGVAAPPPKEKVIELSEAIHEEPAAPVAHVKPPPRPVSKPIPAAAPEAEVGVSKFFLEAEIYLKYGLKEKAIEQIAKFLEKEPKNQQALKKIVELYASTKNKARAVGPLVTLADISMEKGSKEQAEKYLEEAVGFDSSNNEVKVRLKALRGEEEEAEVEEEIEEVKEVEEEIEEIKEVEEEIEVVKEVAKPKEVVAKEKFEIEGLEEKEEIAPSEPPPSARAKVKEPEKEEEEQSFAGLIEEEEEKGEAVDVEELDEAEFYVQQGLVEEAKRIYQNFLKKKPGDHAIIAKLSEIEQLGKKPIIAGREVPVQRMEAEAAPQPRARAPIGSSRPTSEELVARPTPVLIDETAGEGHFDLAKELSDELDLTGEAPPAAPAAAGADQQVSVEEVLSAFKEGVARTVAKEDGQAHYDLGIAYKEMGLIDEAIREFETSSATSVREIDSLSMIGTCYMEKGDPSKAVTYYSRSIASPKATDKEKIGLYYELANAHEANGDLPQAMKYFSMVLEKDQRFRDALKRVHALKDKGVSVVEEKMPMVEAPKAEAPKVEAPPAEEAPAEVAKVIPFVPGRKKVSYI